MVILKPSPKSAKLIQVSPTALSEITGSEYSKFIIKFSSDACPPCRAFQDWLDSGEFKPEKDVVIYKIKLRDESQDEVAQDLRKRFTFRSIPYCVFTDRSLSTKKTLVGWNQQDFEQAVSEYFY